MNTNDKEFVLNKFDYSVRPRDSRVKAEFPGAWMVTDNIDGPEGFAIVGDDVDELINDAYDHLDLPKDTP